MLPNNSIHAYCVTLHVRITCLVLSDTCFLYNVAECPKITTHPQELKCTISGRAVSFTVQATGTEPLSYQWEIKTGNRNGEWQLCDVESLTGANSSTLTIPSVQKSNEGSYRCTVSNCAGSETSESAALTVGELKFS